MLGLVSDSFLIGEQMRQRGFSRELSRNTFLVAVHPGFHIKLKTSECVLLWSKANCCIHSLEHRRLFCSAIFGILS